MMLILNQIIPKEILMLRRMKIKRVRKKRRQRNKAISLKTGQRMRNV